METGDSETAGEAAMNSTQSPTAQLKQATELLREDERGVIGGELVVEFVRRMQSRLIEEREKNAKLKRDFVEAFEGKFAEMRERAEKAERDASLARKHCNDNYDAANLERKRAETAEAELAEARKDSERLDWLFKVGDAAQHSRTAIDAAMKEGK